MQLDIAIVTILAASVSAIVTGGFLVANSLLTRRSEERRQIRELAVKAAIEDWKFRIEFVKHKGSGTIRPLDLYLIHSMCLVQSLDGSLRTKEAICAHLRKVHSMADAAGEEIDNYSNKQ